MQWLQGFPHSRRLQHCSDPDRYLVAEPGHFGEASPQPDGLRDTPGGRHRGRRYHRDHAGSHRRHRSDAGQSAIRLHAGRRRSLGAVHPDRQWRHRHARLDRHGERPLVELVGGIRHGPFDAFGVGLAGGPERRYVHRDSSDIAGGSCRESGIHRRDADGNRGAGIPGGGASNAHVPVHRRRRRSPRTGPLDYQRRGGDAPPDCPHRRPGGPPFPPAPQTLTFQYTAGGAVPPAQDLSITNGGAGTLSWTASSGAWWAVLSATSGNAPGTLSISVNPANLAAGSYATAVTVAATDASVSPASIPVTLVVQGTQPAGTVTAVVNAGSFQPGIASGAWVAIFGANLSQSTYQWQAGDIVNGMLPTSLQGVSVTINGLPAYIDYISPSQINVLAPDDATVGPVQVQVIAAQQASNAVSAPKSQFAPALLTLGGTSVAALHTDYSLVGAPNLLPGAVTTPAKPGETILLYGVGFGPATPPQPSGQQVATAAPLANTVQIAIGGLAASVQYSGLVQSGLYQFNVTVPNLPSGDAKVVATIGGIATQTGVSLTVQQ